MTTLIMTSDYGMDMLLGSSPVLGSGFLSGSPCLGDYNRCGPMWSHNPNVSSLSDQVTTITAKPLKPMTLQIAVNSNSSEAFQQNNLSTNFRRSSSTRKSDRSSTRKRRLGVVNLPLQLEHALKSCLISRQEEEQVPDGAVSPNREKKKVSFADVTGGNLTYVKIITERPDCPPRWTPDFIEQLTGGAKAEAKPDEWALTFSQPASDYINWKRKLERDHIALENLVINGTDSVLEGTIKVRNLTFEKEVLVRYTTNDWICSDDIEATYLSTPSSGCSYNLYDSFTFKIPLPSSSQADKIEFCLCYDADGTSFWDNNNNKNYIIVAFKSKREEKTEADDLYKVNLDSWSEFSAWRHINQANDSPYW